MKNLTTKQLLMRALNIKLLLRVTNKGQLCMPWSDDVIEEHYNTNLSLAKPYAITKALGSKQKGLSVEALSGPSIFGLKQVGQMFTYHPKRKNEQGSCTIAGVLRQIPTEIDGQRIVGFELVDDEHGLFYNPETRSQEEVVKTRLYSLDGDEWNIKRAKEIPVIYHGRKITRDNMDEILEKLGEDE